MRLLFARELESVEQQYVERMSAELEIICSLTVMTSHYSQKMQLASDV